MKKDADQLAAAVPAEASSLAEVSPDDGFAKVEAKLQALKAKMEQDAKKFQEQSEAMPSSFLQEETPSPDEAFAALSRGLQDFRTKLHVQTRKFAQQAAEKTQQIMQDPRQAHMRIEGAP